MKKLPLSHDLEPLCLLWVYSNAFIFDIFYVVLTRAAVKWVKAYVAICGCTSCFQEWLGVVCSNLPSLQICNFIRYSLLSEAWCLLRSFISLFWHCGVDWLDFQTRMTTCFDVWITYRSLFCVGRKHFCDVFCYCNGMSNWVFTRWFCWQSLMIQISEQNKPVKLTSWYCYKYFRHFMLETNGPMSWQIYTHQNSSIIFQKFGSLKSN